MPRFVILEHTPGPAGPREPHWDLMWESGEALRTFALDQSLDSPQGCGCAELLPDHRLAYLDYEGPISGGRGKVRRIAIGRCTLLRETPDEIQLTLRGDNMSANVTLRRESGQPQRWRLIWDEAGSSTAV